jgi:hypothetical protein
MNENIKFNFYEVEEEEVKDENKKVDISELIKKMEDIENSEFESEVENIKVSQIIDYQMNYTIKQLILICDYYGMLKQVKYNKCNKDEIIFLLVDFENDINNEDIVSTRKNMWFYMNELKNNKFMKKYVLW